MLKTPSAYSLLAALIFLFCSIAMGFLNAPEFTATVSDTIKVGGFRNYRETPYVHEPVSMEEQHKKFWSYLSHNSKTTLIAMLAGTLCFAFPAVKASILGFILGVCFWNLGSIELCIRFFFPHALIELPTILYCCAIAQSSGWKWLTAGSGSRWSCLKNEAASNLKIWTVVVLPAVLLSALLEAYVTNR